MDIIKTLHPKNDTSTNVYPNIKSDNIPSGAVSPEKLGFHLYRYSIDIVGLDQGENLMNMLIEYITTNPNITTYQTLINDMVLNEFIKGIGFIENEHILSGVRKFTNNDIECLVIDEIEGEIIGYSFDSISEFNIVVKKTIF